MRSITMIYNETILKDKELNSTDKLVYGIIGVLSHKKGYCYANNKYISEQFNFKERTISKSISKLKKANYIRIENNNHLRKIYITTKEQ